MIQAKLKFPDRLESQIAMNAFDSIPLDHPNLSSEYYKAEIKKGAFLLNFCDGDEILCHTLCLIDEKEFVIVAAIGKNGIFDITKEGLEVMEKYAIEKGCETLRFSTMRIGLVEKAKKYGYRIAEVICRKSLI